MDFVAELKWRGMLKDIMPGTEEQLQKEPTAAYVGFDPTADSLHIGNLVPIMLLVNLQRAGHIPVALVGGATGMVGDPSGKSEERNLLSEELLNHNLAAVQKQLERFLAFEGVPNPARIVNNYDWFKDMGFLEFIRDAGKHITINYMMAKDSVKNRMEKGGLSFTEFTYQLVQGYDFYHLNKTENVKLQMGGSDQWGNITTGTEMIGKMGGGDAYALVCPLVTKADGSKFGKTEKGNVWLDAKYTTPFEFYQFWINAADEDAKTYIRFFTVLPQEEIEALEAEHAEAPHRRVLQKRLAEDVTTRVHGAEETATALRATSILYGKGTAEELKALSGKDFQIIFAGVKQAEVSKAAVEAGVNVYDLFGQTGFLPSNGEVRRQAKQNSLSVNKTKVTLEDTFTAADLINERYLVLQKGKKDQFLVKVV